MGARPEAEVDEALVAAIQATVIQSGKSDRYSFNHSLTQQVLYQAIPRRRRKRLHLAAGHAIEQQPEHIRRARAAELAAHFVKGGMPNRLLPYAVMAGNQACADMRTGMPKSFMASRSTSHANMPRTTTWRRSKRTWD